MEKEENLKHDKAASEASKDIHDDEKQSGNEHKKTKDVEEKKELTPQEKIIELEDKLARTYAEMENQRRRFEKEKDDAFDYGGFIFAKEALNLIDNLARSKLILESDEALKDTEALNKTASNIPLPLEQTQLQ